jgi:hypothetical protein
VVTMPPGSGGVAKASKQDAEEAPCRLPQFVMSEGSALICRQGEHPLALRRIGRDQVLVLRGRHGQVIDPGLGLHTPPPCSMSPVTAS